MAVRDLAPTTYHLTFGSHPAALRVDSGDVIRTTTVDSAGLDALDAPVTKRGNPVTGPFWIEGAEPGDTLKVEILSLRPSRSTGHGSYLLAPSVLEPGFVQQTDGVVEVSGSETGPYGRGRAVWRVDVDNERVHLVSPQIPGLEEFSLPLRPMLGCIAVAPDRGQAISTATSGDFGGNMDYKEIKVGTTMYFPVFTPGALLFVGDGHAVQGAGELAGTGVEISLDVELRVELRKGTRSWWPRGEDSTHIFTLGNSRPLDEATQHATSEMVRWLRDDHQLGFEAASILVGQAADLEIGNMFDPAYTVVCRLDKRLLSRDRD